VAAHLAVALGWWFFADQPYGIAHQRNWASVEQLGEVLRGSRERVQVEDSLRDAWIQLAFVLDRPVLHAPATAPPMAEVGWLVSPAGAPPRPGFEVCALAGPYQLQRRTSRSDDGSEERIASP
jgi:hypothetical protein